MFTHSNRIQACKNSLLSIMQSIKTNKSKRKLQKPSKNIGEEDKKAKDGSPNDFLKKPASLEKRKKIAQKIFSRKPITRLWDDESIWNWIYFSPTLRPFSLSHSAMMSWVSFSLLHISAIESFLRSGHKERLSEFHNSMHDVVSLNIFCNYCHRSTAVSECVSVSVLNLGKFHIIRKRRQRAEKEMKWIFFVFISFVQFPFYFFLLLLARFSSQRRLLMIHHDSRLRE